MNLEQLERWQQKARELAKMIGEMFYGMTVYEMVRDLNKERGMIERLFILAVFGDLRLLPHVVPNIQGWRHSMLRERDLTDLCDQEIT